MIAVFSNWSAPLGNSGFLSRNDYILSLALSVKCARDIFPEVHFYGDKKSIDLIEGKIPFDKVFDSLEILNEKKIPPELSSYSRIFVYSLMDQPFAYINSDVYIREPLPQHILDSNIFCQGWEHNTMSKGIISLKNNGFYGNEYWERFYNDKSITSIPNMQIFGGNQFECIRQYASDIISMVEHPFNMEVLMHKRFLTEEINKVLEQWYAVVRFIYFEGVEMDSLFNENGICPIKYTHIIDDAKKNRSIMEKVKNKCKKEIKNLIIID